MFHADFDKSFALIRAAWSYRRGALAVAILSVLLLPLCPICRADDELDNTIPTLTAAQLSVQVDHWTVEDGLPNQIVTALAQTPDGYIWCASFFGLTRFDGVKFKVFDNITVPGMDGIFIMQLWVDGDGALWVKGLNGALGKFDGTRLIRLREKDGFPAGGAAKASIDDSGKLWFRGRKTDSFYRVMGGGKVAEVLFKGISAGQVDTFHVDESGQAAWAIMGKSRELVRLSIKENPEVIEFSSRVPRPNFGRFFKNSEGHLAASSAVGPYVLKDGEWMEDFQAPYPISLTGKGVLDGGESLDGTQWLGVYEYGLLAETVKNRFGQIPLGTNANNFIRALLIDDEGNVWVGKNDGLFRIRKTPFRNYTKTDDLDSLQIRSIAEANDGTIWVASGAFVYRSDKKRDRFKKIAMPDGLKAIRVAKYQNGGILIGTLQGEVLLWEEGGMKKIAAIRLPIRALLQDLNGQIWIGTNRGLWKYLGEKAERISLGKDLGQGDVLDLQMDRGGVLYASIRGAGVLRLERSKWTNISNPAIAQTRNIGAFRFDADNVLWGTSRGNYVVTLRREQWFLNQKFPSELPAGLRVVIPDRTGKLWIPSFRGVHAIKMGSAMDESDTAFDSLYSATYFRSDGLGSSNCINTSSGALLAADGRVWVATQNGVAVVDPKELDEEGEFTSQAYPLIEKILIDQVPLEKMPTSLAEIRVKDGASIVDLFYTATGLGDPVRGRFRYRIPEIEQRWIDLGFQRRATILKPEPGSYHFELQAANSRGIWGADIFSIPLIVETPWWQSSLFQMLAVVGVAIILLLLLYSRNRKIIKEMEVVEGFSRLLIQAQEKERMKVGGELHDSLGQELLVIKSRLDMGIKKEQGEQKSLDLLEVLSRSMADAIQQVKQLSRGLRPALIESLGLKSALQAMLHEVSDATGIPIEVNIGEIDDWVSDDTKINLYRIVQEGVNNVVAHSDASEVWVSLLAEGHFICLSIKDDGRGISDGGNPTLGKGMGLKLISERAILLGGKFEVQSKPGEGTCLRINVPIEN